MKYNFWWSSASDELASDNVITSGAVLFRRFKLPFYWFLCSLLFFQNLIMILKFCLWSCTLWTNISISNWQFLVPCYILFQHYLLPLLPFCQVKAAPLVGRCIRLLLSVHNWKSFIAVLEGVKCHLCSWAPKMELKSPIKHQGIGWFMCKNCRDCHNPLLFK